MNPETLAHIMLQPVEDDRPWRTCGCAITPTHLHLCCDYHRGYDEGLAVDAEAVFDIDGWDDCSECGGWDPDGDLIGCVHCDGTGYEPAAEQETS